MVILVNAAAMSQGQCSGKASLRFLPVRVRRAATVRTRCRRVLIVQVARAPVSAISCSQALRSAAIATI